MTLAGWTRRGAGAFGRAWQRLWYVDVDPFVLRLFRVCLGVYLLLFYAMLGPSWLEFYGPHGILPDLLRRSGELTPLTLPIFYVTTDVGMWVYYGVSVAAAACLVAGWFGALPVAWLWLTNAGLTYRNVYASNAEEQVLAFVLFFAMFLPMSARFWPWERATSAGRPTNGKVTVWALRPLQVYFASIYLFSLPWKILEEPAWTDGSLVYYATKELLYSRWPELDVFAWWGGLFSRIVTWATLLLELAFPLLVWFRRTRAYVVVALIALHLGIGFLLEGVTMFNGAMIVGLVAFLPSRRTRELWEGLRTRWSGSGEATAGELSKAT